MEQSFIITKITRVVMVGKDEYPEKMVSFTRALSTNELIFHISGHATVYFDDLTLETAPNTVRFLPEGRQKRYDVLRHERGECIDICFNCDRPISPSAFVIDVRQSDKIGALFKKLFAVWASRGEGYYFESISLLYRIFAELQKKNYIPQNQYNLIKPAIEYIEENFLRSKIPVASCFSLF